MSLLKCSRCGVMTQSIYLNPKGECLECEESQEPFELAPSSTLGRLVEHVRRAKPEERMQIQLDVMTWVRRQADAPKLSPEEWTLDEIMAREG